MTRHPAIPLSGALVVLCSLCWPAGLPATAAEPATGRAAAASSTGNVAARVGVRSGEHPTFTRLVFDWTVPVQYTVESADGQVRVQFHRSAELAIDRIVARPPEGLSGFGQSRDGDGRTTFGFTADGRIRHFRDGTKVVVDVMKAPEKAAGAPAGPVASAVSPAAAAPADQLRAEIYWRARDWKGAAAMLSRLVGVGAANDIMLSGRTLSGSEAGAIGLANGVIEGDAVFDHDFAYARDLAANCSPLAMRTVKMQMYQDLMDDFTPSFARSERLLDEVLRGEDVKEGIAAVRAKRPVNFPGLDPSLARSGDWPK